MCGVIGVSLKDVSAEDLSLVREVFQQTMVRGKHATGVSYVKNGKVHTDKEGIPVTEFFKTRKVEDWVNEDGGLYLIGHIRYSTSDLRYNQPIGTEELSIAHNGVISQEDSSQWEYKCETENDSELILRTYLSEEHPLIKYWNRSMAVVKISADKVISGFRNHERPLWHTERDNGVIFTSTRDIAKRSGMKNSEKCDMFVEYFYSDKLHTTSYYNIAVKHQIKDLQ